MKKRELAPFNTLKKKGRENEERDSSLLIGRKEVTFNRVYIFKEKLLLIDFYFLLFDN
jgi:hypothetical protein